jgi:rfaE bifunctional protein kinase chain/domain
VTASLSDIVHLYAKVKVLVVGDSIIDQYHFGRVDRISPEAPCMVFVEDYDKHESRRGGADNVAHQLEVLGCQVETLFSTRYSVKHRFMVGQYQVFRRDSDGDRTPSAADIAKVKDLAMGQNVIVLSDYAKGWLTHELCRAVIETGKPVIVDPKGKNWTKYLGCFVMCPNEKELNESEPLYVTEDGPHHHVIITKGEKGVQLNEIGKESVNIPATAHQVFDVTGAGDVVTALIAAGIGAGASLYDSAVLANFAAGVVVGKVGTSVCTKEELLACLG